jgi:hypothetical protein
MSQKIYVVKKGPADPFRGDWYSDEKPFADLETAISIAAALTIANYESLMNNWEEFGYEWSVFEKVEAGDTKLWEGFKYIFYVRNGKTDLDAGKL